MEIKQKLIVNSETLERNNKGFNFLNVDEEVIEKKYYLNVNLVIEQDLKKKEENVYVETDLIIGRFYQYSFEEFLKDLKEFCKKPLVNMKRTSNRINKNSWDRDIDSLENKIRTKSFIFSDIDIKVGELAEQKLKEKEIDFKKEIKKILDQQDNFNKENQKLIDRFIYLKDKLLTLKSFMGNVSSRWTDKPKDNTLKIMISPTEYNEKMKVIEKEMKTIAKVFDLDLKEMDYIVIEEKKPFDDWFKDNEEDLKENYEIYCEDDDFEGCSDFEEYTKMMYEEFGSELDIKEEGYY